MRDEHDKTNAEGVVFHLAAQGDTMIARGKLGDNLAFKSICKIGDECA